MGNPYSSNGEGEDIVWSCMETCSCAITHGVELTTLLEQYANELDAYLG